VKDIVYLHDTMTRICKDSELKGLNYQAGCRGKCTKCQRERLMICMEFNKGAGEMMLQPNGDNCRCDTCKKKVNILKCLKVS